MRFDAVLFDNGGTLTHRTSPVAAVRALAARLGVNIPEEQAAHYWRRSKEHSRSRDRPRRVHRHVRPVLRPRHRQAGSRAFMLACERLGVSPQRALMVGNNRLADSGSICVGCHCLILPPVPPGATRGLRAAADAAGIAWAE